MCQESSLGEMTNCQKVGDSHCRLGTLIGGACLNASSGFLGIARVPAVLTARKDDVMPLISSFAQESGGQVVTQKSITTQLMIIIMYFASISLLQLNTHTCIMLIAENFFYFFYASIILSSVSSYSSFVSCSSAPSSVSSASGTGSFISK